VGLQAISQYGFVLAGGYALSANGIGDRPSKDVDLFSTSQSEDLFAEAAQKMIAAFRADGLIVDILQGQALFYNVSVADPATGEKTTLQLGSDLRSYPPMLLSIGPTLDPRDAAAAKMISLYSRGELRDYIDVHTSVSSGRFAQEDVLALGDHKDRFPWIAATWCSSSVSWDGLARSGSPDTEWTLPVERQ